VGWGATSSAGTLSDRLREADVPVQAQAECRWSTAFCAGDGDPAVCAGDSGSPLLVEDGGELVLVGVVVAGSSDCGGGSTDLYAEVGSQPLHGWLGDRLGTTDTVAPRVTSSSPTGSTAARRADVVVGFSEPVDPDTVTRSTYRLLHLTADGPRRVRDVRVTVGADGRTARLDPFGAGRARLAAAARYRAVVTTEVRDVAGRRLDQSGSAAGPQAKTWTFRTAR
jgi:hypothetical protein